MINEIENATKTKYRTDTSVYNTLITAHLLKYFGVKNTVYIKIFVILHYLYLRERLVYVQTCYKQLY